jgi:hypothetical protein
MNAHNEENLERLFEKFVESNSSFEFSRNDGWAKKIFHDYPTAEVDEQITARIKNEVATRLKSKGSISFRQMAYRVAAVLIILGILSILLFLESEDISSVPSTHGIPAIVWDSEEIEAEDTVLATLAAEIEQIEGELLVIESGEGMRASFGEVEELEAELLDIDSDFWKG